MNFIIMSFNVYGLNGLDLVRLLRNYVEKVSHIDMLCIQKYKLQLMEAKNLSQFIYIKDP